MNTKSHHTACDEFASKLADHLEEDLPGAGRAAMEAHASSCAECGRLLSELESLRMDAASLPLLEPSRDLWAGIAERIDARVFPLDTGRRTRVAAMRRTWRHPAVAAAALMLLTAGVTHVWTRLSYETPAVAPSATRIATATPVIVEPTSVAKDTNAASGGRPAAANTVRSLGRGTPRQTEVRASAPARTTLVARPVTAGRIMKTDVEPVYDREIVKLRAIVRERRSQLDPRTVAVLEQSIAVIDSAIVQSRAALAKDPASGFLATQLKIGRASCRERVYSSV